MCITEDLLLFREGWKYQSKLLWRWNYLNRTNWPSRNLKLWYKESVDGNFEDVTTAILREIGDTPDSDSGSEMELESQHELARGRFLLIKRIAINNFNICAHLI